MDQPVSITIFKQITRADGTVEPRVMAAYANRDPVEEERVKREHGIEGEMSGTLVDGMRGVACA